MPIDRHLFLRGKHILSLCALALVGCETNAFHDAALDDRGDDGAEFGQASYPMKGHIGTTDASLYIVTDDPYSSDPKTFPLLVSNGRGFQFTCDDDYDGILRLVDGVGFNSGALSLYPQATFASQSLISALGLQSNVSYDDLGKLPCKFTSSNGYLYKINVDGIDEYFLDMLEPDMSQPDAAARKYILRTVGCGELLLAMGLDPRQATPLDLAFAQRYFLLDDKYNINCAKGTPPSQLVPTLTAPNGGLNQAQNRGAYIASLEFTVEHLQPGNTATLLTTIDECGGPFSISGLKVTGPVRKGAPLKACETRFVARVVIGKDAAGKEITFDTNELTLHIDLPCEINSLANCGTCGNACVAQANQTTTCAPWTPGGTDFACQPKCNDGWADCDSGSQNGCETALSTTANCGRCGNTCTASFSSMEPTCVNGSCGSSCRSLFADCDNDPSNGCESDLSFRSSCGTCSSHCTRYANCVSLGNGPTCQCMRGYEGDGYTCAPIDMCKTNNGGCSPLATCTQIAPDQVYCACNPGFTGDGRRCDDIDECATDNGGCSYFATCKNTWGSRTCECMKGFAGDGITCEMINMCATNNGGCSPNAACYSKYGSVWCWCNPMYEGDGYTCNRKPVNVEGPYSWRQGSGPVNLGSGLGRMCWLSKMTGKFMGDGEHIEVTQDGNNAITLSGGSAQVDVAGDAMCAATDAPYLFTRTWSQGNPFVYLGPANDRVCFLTAVSGRFEGGGEAVFTTIDNGAWYLGGRSQKSGVSAQAACFGGLNYSDETVWTQSSKYNFPYLAGPGTGCALTFISGKFKGGGESVYIDNYMGYLYLVGASQQIGVEAHARCFW